MDIAINISQNVMIGLIIAVMFTAAAVMFHR